MTGHHRGVNLLETVRKKGTDFDKGVKPDTLDQLIKLGGIFQLKDIIDRLPFNQYTVKNWVYQETSRFQSCFHLVPVGAVRSMKLIDLTMFNQILQNTLNESHSLQKRAQKPRKNVQPPASKKPKARRK